MKELTKIRESIIKLRQDLGPRQTQLILYGFCALVLVLILVFAYGPLARKLGAAQRKFNDLQTQLLTQRDNIATFKKIDFKSRRLMQQREVSLAIDEITEEGSTLGLKFSSITPGELQKETQGNFKVLPIAFQIECVYESLGKFLVYLEEFPRTIGEVKSLSISPTKGILPKLNAEVLVNLYMEGKDAQ